MSEGFRYRLIGGRAHWRTITLPFIVERIEMEPTTPTTTFLRRQEWYYLVRVRAGRGVMVAERCLPLLRARQQIRRDIALYIARHLEQFVICEICSTIQPRAMLQTSPLCNGCNGYHFSSRPSAIQHRAAIVAASPPAWLNYSFGF